MKIKNIKVLIADDEKNQRDILKGFLTNIGFQENNIYSAENGLLAFNYLEKNYILLLITDTNMPEMDGVELIEKIKKNKKIRERIKIIVISGAHLNEESFKLLWKGEIKFLQKPFKIESFKKSITDILSLN